MVWFGMVLCGIIWHTSNTMQKASRLITKYCITTRWNGEDIRELVWKIILPLSHCPFVPFVNIVNTLSDYKILSSSWFENNVWQKWSTFVVIKDGRWHYIHWLRKTRECQYDGLAEPAPHNCLVPGLRWSLLGLWQNMKEIQFVLPKSWQPQ